MANGFAIIPGDRLGTVVAMSPETNSQNGTSFAVSNNDVRTTTTRFISVA